MSETIARTREKRLSRLREEHFTQTLEDVRQAARLKHLMSLSPAEWWAEIRDGIIEPTLADAAKVLDDSGLSAEQIQKNGGSGTMLAVAPPDDPSNGSHLTFTFASKVIRVSSSEVDIPILNEVMDDRQYVTAGAVTAKVDRFIQAIASRYPEPDPTGGGMA